MATWPTTLPSPNVSGYGIEQTAQTVRTDMDAGNPRVRRRSAQRIDTVSVSWIFSDAEMLIFRAWFENATTGAAGGSAWFSIDLATGASGIATIDARFTGAFSAKLRPGLNWAVDAQLETRT